jgi:DNA-binding FadR family transcriptional regulator
VSWVALAHAWHIAVPPRDKLVLLALADHANDEDFTCFPSIRHLAEKCCMDRATVFRALASLEEHGLIRRKRKTINGVVPFNAPNVYELVYARIAVALG